MVLWVKRVVVMIWDIFDRSAGLIHAFEVGCYTIGAPKMVSARPLGSFPCILHIPIAF